MCYIRNDNNQQPAGEGICTRWARGLLSCTLTPMLPTTAASGKKVSCVYMCICVCVYLCVGVYSVCVCIWGVCVYLCASVCVHVYVSVSVLSMCVCVHLCVYLYVHVWGLGMYLCICPHIQECGCVWLFLCLVCGYVWRTVWLSACVCVCLCAHLWPMCMTVNLSDCLCVCVCVFPPPCPMLQKLSMQPQTGFPLWSFIAQARLLLFYLLLGQMHGCTNGSWVAFCADIPPPQRL